MTPFLVVSGASGTWWPESRSIPQDLGRGLNWPLWAVIGGADQKDQSWQAQNHCCRHSHCRGVSLSFMCGYEMYLSVPHGYQCSGGILKCKYISAEVCQKMVCTDWIWLAQPWIVSNNVKTYYWDAQYEMPVLDEASFWRLYFCKLAPTWIYIYKS